MPPEQPTAAQTRSTIEVDAPLATLVNVFTVEPQDQGRLVELLDRASEEVMRHIPGFVSANIHRSLDGTKVLNYAQWSSVEAFQAMLQDPSVQPHMEAILAIATSEPALYSVESVHHG